MFDETNESEDFSDFNDVDLSSLDPKNNSQVQLELLYSKYQVHSAITDYFISVGAQKQLDEMDTPTDFGMDLLVQMELHKRANIPTLVGLLKKHFEHLENPAQSCADALDKALDEDLADWEEFSQQVVVRHQVSAEVRAQMERYQYPLPMVQEPNEVQNNKQTGYLTIRKSIILRNNHHNEDVCLDHINRVNQIPLSLNPAVVAFVQNRWKNLDKPKVGESKRDFDRRKKAFEKYDRSSRDVLAALMTQGNRFWLTHRYDKRGRTYAQGYHANYQGNDWNKACIQFADGEPLNDH